MTEKPTLKQFLIRHQMMARAIMVVAATILLGVVGLIPLLSSAGTTLKKIQTRQKEEAALSQKVSLLSQIDQDVLKDRARVIKAALPENKDVIVYLAAVDGLSKELGLTFGGITVSPGEVSGSGAATRVKGKSKTVGTLQVLDTQVKITGSKDGIYAFLRQVEQTMPLMQVADVSVTNIGVDQYTLSLNLGMLWAPVGESDLKGAISLFSEQEEGYFQKLATFRSYRANTTATNESGIIGKQDLFQE